MSMDRERRETGGAAGGDGWVPVEVVRTTAGGDHGGGDGPDGRGDSGTGGRVRVTVQGGTTKVAVGGCTRAGCCIAWVVLLAFGLLVGVIWLVKAIWVRV